MTDLTQAQAGRLAAAIRAGPRPPRRAVRDFFDSWVRETADATGARPVNFLHAVHRARAGYPALDPARDADALTLALAALGSGEEIAEWLSAAVARGLFDPVGQGAGPPDKARDRVLGAAGKALGRTAADTIVSLQGVTLQQARSAAEVFTDPGHLLPAIQTARRRVCRITSRATDTHRNVGTGFLVGPSAVLTNFHVVEHLLGPDVAPTGPFPPRNADDNLTCHFDYSATTGRMHDEASKFVVSDDWCLGFRRAGRLQPANAGDFWWHDDRLRAAWLDGLGDDLDFAVLRLDGAPGLQRGWYDLDDLGALDQSRGCWTFHHPGGDTLKMTGGTVFKADFDRPRLFHGASTLPGSSGGLIVNQRGTPIALHHAGIGLDVHDDDQIRMTLRPWDEYINHAIPLRQITRVLRADGLLDRMQAPSVLTPYTGLVESGHPVFGREDFFRLLVAFYAPPPGGTGRPRNVLRIHADPAIPPAWRPGKSFSVRIIRHVFAGADHHHVELGPDDRKKEARDLAEALMNQLDPDRSRDLDQTLNTTGPAFAKALASDIRSVLQTDRYLRQTVWVHLDGLEHASVPDSSGREFLASLYATADQVDNLRIVLVGLPEDIQIGGLRSGDVQTYRIALTEVADLESRLRDWLLLRSRGGLEEGPALDLLLDAVAAFARAGAPFERAAQFASAYLRDPLAALTGPRR